MYFNTTAPIFVKLNEGAVEARYLRLVLSNKGRLDVALGSLHFALHGCFLGTPQVSGKTFIADVILSDANCH